MTITNKKIMLFPSLLYCYLRPFLFLIFPLLLFTINIESKLFNSVRFIHTFFFCCLYLYNFFYTKTISYTITDEQVIYKRGVFNFEIDYLELYRIKDIKVRKTLLMRFIKTMEITLYSSDKSNPNLKLIGISEKFDENLIRLRVEKNRMLKGVFEVD